MIWRPKVRLPLVAAVLGMVSGKAHAQISTLDSREQSSCEIVEVDANELRCQRGECLLLGQAHMSCDALDLWADEIEIYFDDDRRFTGAIARGDVAAVEGDSILYCDEARLKGDRIRGRLEGATVEIKERSAPLEDLIDIRNRAVIRGEVQRDDERTIHVEDSEFTICDCGDDDPTWELRSRSIDANLDNRALLYWSVLWINPFGWLELPFSPPIPIMSIPLKSRAAGFLPPKIQFFDSFKPLIDVPLFVPLGDSYDVTFIPGIRTDWTTQEGNALDEFGAPRFGTRLRYAPTRGTEGEITLQYQRDAGARAFVNALEEDGGPDTINPCLESDSPTEGPRPAQCDLNNRFAVDISHRSELNNRSDFLLSGQWFSDDDLLGQSSVAVTNVIQAYLRSRAQLDYRSPWVYTLASADYILRLNNGTSNTGDQERDTLHRGPYFELRLPAAPILPGLYADAKASAIRYGELFKEFYNEAEPLTPSQWVFRSTGGLNYADGIGPVAFRARAGIDSVWSVISEPSSRALESGFDPINAKDRQVVSLIAEAHAELPLGRRYGEWFHSVSPRIGIRTIPWQNNTIPWEDRDPETNQPVLSIFDPALQRERLYQVLIALDQELLVGAESRLRLVIEQPFDLPNSDRSQKVEELQTTIRLNATPLPDFNVTATTQIAHQPDENRIREFGLQARYRYGIASANASYTRWFADAERFRRTIFELAAAPSFDEETGPGEQYITFGTALSGEVLRLSYTFQYLLPRPGGDNDDNLFRPFTSIHGATAGYQSPCRCWGIGAGVQFIRQQVPDDEAESGLALDWEPRFNITFSIGDYTLGATQ